MVATPKKNTAYVFSVGLVDSTDAGVFLTNPTIAAGDFQVSTGFGALANLATLPAVDPANSGIVKISLSAAEMNADEVIVKGKDAAGAEWSDVHVHIDAPVSNIDDVVTSDRSLIQETTIATLASQTSFTLTAGSADDKAYEGLTIVIEDATTAVQKAVGIVDTYTGATKTVLLLEDPGVFTMAVGDKVYVLAEKGIKPTTSVDFHLDISSGGTAGIDWANVDNKTSTVVLSGTTIGVVTLVTTTTTNTDMRGTDSANTIVPMTAALSQTEHDATQTLIGALNDFNPTTDTVALVTLVTTTTTNTDMRGTDGANTVVPMTAALSQTEHDATQTLIGALNDFNPATDTVALVTLVTTTTTNTDMRGTDSAFLAAVMTESYRATNAAPTPAEAFFEILAHMGESASSGTTKTLKKLDGSTTAKTYTYDDASDPTSITETT